MKKLGDWRRKAAARPGPADVRSVARRCGVDVTEQDDESAAPVQGEFPVVVLRWVDITAHMVEGGGEEARAALAGELAEGHQMLEFLHAGVLVREDEKSLTLMHSMSLVPARSEFWTFPRGVILDERRVGTVRIEGRGFKVR